MHDGSGHERVTKSYPVFDCDAHINDPGRSGTTSRAREPESRPQHVLAGRRRGLAQRRHAGHGRRQRTLPRLQPDLHRRPADEQEDHAEAQHDAAHGGAESVRAPRRRHRPARAAPRDGPHGHRPGARDPDDGDHARAVRRRTPKVSHAFCAGLQRLRRRLVQRGARAGSSPPRCCPRQRRGVHGEGDRARRRARAAGRPHPPDRRAGEVPQRGGAVDDGDAASTIDGLPRLRGDGHGARDAHLPGAQRAAPVGPSDYPGVTAGELFNRGRLSTRRPSRSCTRCRCGCRRCSSAGCSTATRSSRWPCSSRTRSGCRTRSKQL